MPIKRRLRSKKRPSKVTKKQTTKAKKASKKEKINVPANKLPSDANKIQNSVDFEQRWSEIQDRFDSMNEKMVTALLGKEAGVQYAKSAAKNRNVCPVASTANSTQIKKSNQQKKPKLYANKKQLDMATILPKKNGQQYPRMRCFDVNCCQGLFNRLQKPSYGDWLSDHPEKGQTIKQFDRKAMKATPHGTYNTIYIQPYDTDNDPIFRHAIEFVSIFYQPLNVVVLPVKPMDSTWKKRKSGYTDGDQYLARDMMDTLKKPVRSEARSSLMKVGITSHDIVNKFEWSFVYGVASISDGVGVYSLARLRPKPFPEPLTEEEEKHYLLRTSRVFAHEIGHIFGLKHCIYYKCLMNGSNHEEEMDSKPAHFCPICLRKLHMSLGFDVIDRYENMLTFMKKWNVESDIEWLQMRLDQLRA